MWKRISRVSLSFVLLFMLSGLSSTGCGVAEEITCTYEGKTYANHAKFPAKDGCNTCSCIEGTAVCTAIGCAPKVCGGKGGATCSKDEFCNMPTHCGANDKGGECTRIPKACDQNIDPVCGCDKKTYNNSCAAHGAGVSVMSKGKCPETGKSCDYNGKTYKDGESFPDKDGCNTCTCKDGKVDCQADPCPLKSCKVNGKEYKSGDKWDKGDGCNTCDCFNGTATCTEKTCSKDCKYDGKGHKDGTTFPATDGCNTCTCTAGQVSCTQKACPKDCKYGGKDHKDGESFPATDGCNTCTCKDGAVACTQKTCPKKSCQYDGKEHQDGTTFPATDGCNTCTCNDGKVQCTEKTCPKNCIYDGKTHNHGDSFPATDGCNTCTCTDGAVTCTKKLCGCTSNSDCQSTEYCAVAIGQCGSTGTCKLKPTACPRDINYHCGCDGKDYINPCAAYSQGMNLKAKGKCQPTTSCTYQGTTYQDGDTFIAIDGCNTCTCSKGSVGCTKIGCGTVCKTDTDCKSTEYCHRVTGYCKATAGNCKTKPISCTREYKPVCGCNGKTYSNACVAASAGISVSATGACSP